MINTIAAAHGFARPYSDLRQHMISRWEFPISLALALLSKRLSDDTAYSLARRPSRVWHRTLCRLFEPMLGRTGLSVWTDRPEMLAVATRNCASSNVCLLQQDIRCLRLPYPVDLITANFDTMNHLLTEPDLRLASGAYLREFAARRSFHLRSHHTLPASGQCEDLHPTPQLRKSQSFAANTLGSMAEDFVDLRHHSLTVFQGLNVGGPS